MLSYIPEERMRDGMIRDFTVAENIILREHQEAPFSRGGFLDLRSIASYSDRLISSFQVKTPSRDTLAKNLSGGNIQKVVLARELSRHPRAIVAAQPTRGLDIGATEYVRGQLLQQRQAGTAILLISEDLDEILALSDRIAVIYEGQIMAMLDRSEDSGEAGPADGRRACGKAVGSHSIGSVVAGGRLPAAAWAGPSKVPPSFGEAEPHEPLAELHLSHHLVEALLAS
jgi:simple sugar transport system ATP-binding protein